MDKKFRVGILGLGRAGRFMHGPELALFPGFFEIAAACDHAADRRENLPEAFANAKIYSSLIEMLKDDSLDIITIATRNGDHVPHALQVLEAGKMAVIDKPFAVNMEQVSQLREADKKYPGKIFLRCNRRFEPAFVQIREVIDSGILGEIAMVKIYRHPGFVRRCDWQTLAECHGGLFNNWGPHFVDQALQLLNSPVKDIWCSLQHHIGGGDAEDQVKLILTGENNRIIDLEISTISTIPGHFYEIWGKRGSLVIDNTGKEMKLRYLKPEVKFTRLDGVKENFPLVYGNPNENLQFIEETRPIVQPRGHVLQRGKKLDQVEGDWSKGYTYPDTMWYYLYQALTGQGEYPVTLADGVAIVETMAKAKKVAGFTPSVLEF